MEGKEYVEYIKSHGFPEKKYKHKTSFDKKILYNNTLEYEEEEDVKKNTKEFISKYQSELRDSGIGSYVGGGYAIKLQMEGVEEVKTTDIDLITVYKDKIVNISVIIRNLTELIECYIRSIKEDGGSIIRVISVIEEQSNRGLDKIIEIMIDKGYKLTLSNKKEGTHMLYFVRVLREIKIKIRIKLEDIKRIKDNNQICYNNISCYNIKGLYKRYKYAPIDMVVIKEGRINEKEMIENKEGIKLYNKKYILYNLMHLYHNYQIKNNSTQKKIKEGKEGRDEKRIEYILKEYLKGKYKEELLEKIKKSYKKFKKHMFKIKDLGIIDEIIGK